MWNSIVGRGNQNIRDTILDEKPPSSGAIILVMDAVVRAV